MLTITPKIDFEEIKRECAAGRGEQLLDRFIIETAEGFAASTLLHMERFMRDPDLLALPDLMERLQGFVEQRGITLIDMTLDSLRQFNSDEATAEKFATRAAYAFRLRMEALLESAQVGGSA